MKSGDFVYIEYVGRIKDSGEIFDLTDENIAKEKGIFNEKFKYKPVPVIIGSEFLIKGLNEALEKMNVGERKTIEITPENAFGDRKPELIRLIPESRFKEQDIEARPGNIVNVNNIRGRIISVDGGRIRVDFNHPLAGKTLEYDLKITKEITDDKEKIQAIVYYFSSIEDVVVELKEDSAEISIKVDIPRNSKEIMANTILKWLKEIKKVIFKEEFENK